MSSPNDLSSDTRTPSAVHPDKAAIATLRIPGDGVLSRADLVAIADALEVSERDAAVKVVLLRGAAPDFCRGLDLAEFADADGLDDLAATLTRCFTAFADRRKPMVVALDGSACGFGATMLCHADMVIASERARFHMPFLDLGLFPEAGSTLLLPERIGYLNAFRLLGLGEEIDATEAARIGLVSKVVSNDTVDAKALQAASHLARRPPGMVATARGLMRPDRPDLIGRIQEEVRLSLDRARDPLVRRRLSRMSTARRAKSQTQRTAA